MIESNTLMKDYNKPLHIIDLELTGTYSSDSNGSKQDIIKIQGGFRQMIENYSPAKIPNIRRREDPRVRFALTTRYSKDFIQELKKNIKAYGLPLNCPIYTYEELHKNGTPQEPYTDYSQIYDDHNIINHFRETTIIGQMKEMPNDYSYNPKEAFRYRYNDNIEDYIQPDSFDHIPLPRVDTRKGVLKSSPFIAMQTPIQEPQHQHYGNSNIYTITQKVTQDLTFDRFSNIFGGYDYAPHNEHTEHEVSGSIAFFKRNDLAKEILMLPCVQPYFLVTATDKRYWSQPETITKQNIINQNPRTNHLASQYQ
ncbi:MAG: hypothetical protein ACI83O_000855 [Patescibacteria group bacterium]|jgi:hypothetical protein